MVWLHGTLNVTIHEARNIPRDRLIRFPDKAKHALKPLDALISKTEKITLGDNPSNAYVVIAIGDSRRARTTINTSFNPVWNETFEILVADQEDAVSLIVKDADMIGAPQVGLISFSTASLLQGQIHEGWFPLIDSVGKPLKHGASMRVTLAFRSVFSDDDFRPGSAVNGVPGTYFPPRDGCMLRLYNDAHQDPKTPAMQLPNGGSFQPRGAWGDMYDAICGAQHLIYIAGWSVYDKITIVRDPSKPMLPSDTPTLGELLKRKAEEGVSVLLLVWDDRTSVNSPLLRGGLMATHDEDTRVYFQDTKVVCAIVPREGGTADSTTQKLTKGNMFTHHQKTVVVDSPDHRNPDVRKLTAFLGGIDLCDGRYDTPEHSLFHTLNTVHSHDFHQACAPGADIRTGGPRQSWHDIHCRVEGPAATDVLVNFVQRWLKQAEDKKDKLLPLPQIPDVVAPETQVRGPGEPAAFVIDLGDPEAWRAQIFRSIDSDSAAGMPTGSKASKLGLDSGKGKVIDASIHSAYVTAIRRAQRFIYIENQYFLGSSHAWAEDRETPCRHLIPLEIALKIVAKINAGERFAAYIVLPMYSEGDPESASVQEILRFQTHTIKMMYGLIALALKARNMSEHPRDFLNFFCLGNREIVLPTDAVPEAPPAATTYAARAQVMRRFLIYVHSKMMIVDDEYIIIGSANINQRSQDGTRDTEIAVGALQPNYSISPGTGSTPKGQVHAFRMTLWKEHTNGIFDSFYDPSSLKCVQDMAGIGKANWDAFMSPEPCDLFGHLLMYPLQINPDGSVEEYPGGECFPDSAAKVVGSAALTLPNVLTS